MLSVRYSDFIPSAKIRPVRSFRFPSRILASPVGKKRPFPMAPEDAIEIGEEEEESRRIAVHRQRQELSHGPLPLTCGLRIRGTC